MSSAKDTDGGVASETIDMQRVADLVKASGVPCYVEQTGGGCATIYAGVFRDGKPAVMAGPGWFDGPGWTRPVGHTSDFYVGDATAVTGAVTAGHVAELVVRAVDEADKAEEVLQNALQAADTAFWAAVAAAYPQATAGDVDPFTAHLLEEQQRRAVAAWVRNNVPATGGRS